MQQFSVHGNLVLRHSVLIKSLLPLSTEFSRHCELSGEIKYFPLPELDLNPQPSPLQSNACAPARLVIENCVSFVLSFIILALITIILKLVINKLSRLLIPAIFFVSHHINNKISNIKGSRELV